VILVCLTAGTVDFPPERCLLVDNDTHSLSSVAFENFWILGKAAPGTNLV
jgi:hypothetical protein